jgi:hypothetical protein
MYSRTRITNQHRFSNAFRYYNNSQYLIAVKNDSYWTDSKINSCYPKIRNFLRYTFRFICLVISSRCCLQRHINFFFIFFLQSKDLWFPDVSIFSYRVKILLIMMIKSLTKSQFYYIELIFLKFENSLRVVCTKVNV